MAGPSWLVDGNRFASKIKSASGTYDLGEVKWKSNPTRSCPRCQHTIDNSDVAQAWPGLPRGVKFDPSDQEIIQHLTAKIGAGDERAHPFIDEFIPTVDEEDGICYTHPRNLPGVKQDGSASHFFHRAIKAYNTGTRKRRKIHGDDLGDVRWHKTGRTKPVILNGVQKGCKKIMVLYVSSAKGGKPEKTNWVMHQYHLGTAEDEKDGEFVISKVFCQQPQVKPGDKDAGDTSDLTDDVVLKVDPVTPKSVTPEPPRNERRLDPRKETMLPCVNSVAEDHHVGCVDEVRQPEVSKSSVAGNAASENLTEVVDVDDNQDHDMGATNVVRQPEASKSSDDDNTVSENLADQEDSQVGEDNKWWDSESQYLIDSQQLVEGLSLCDDLLQSQSPNRDDNTNDAKKKKFLLSEYARLGPEDLKKDLEYARLGPEDLKKNLEECQNLELANIDLDTPPDFRLSQLEFGSQESFLAWGGSKAID